MLAVAQPQGSQTNSPSWHAEQPGQPAEAPYFLPAPPTQMPSAPQNLQSTPSKCVHSANITAPPPRDGCHGQGALLSRMEALGSWEPETLSSKRNRNPLGNEITLSLLQRLQRPLSGQPTSRSPQNSPICS